MQEYFNEIPPIRFGGEKSTDHFTFRHYDPNQRILGKRMEDHLRVSVCYWHTFGWQGADTFGARTFEHKWQANAAEDPLGAAHAKADAAFEFIRKLGLPFYSFHDTDVAPEGKSITEYVRNNAIMIDYLERKQAETGVRLLWGTANCFSHPRYAAGAATNPNPEVFAWAATQVFTAMNATHRLGGQNYVLWGGREGYETLLNTDLRRERKQLGRFLQMVVEHKHKIGFDGTILIEPKPHEPSKH